MHFDSYDNNAVFKRQHLLFIFLDRVHRTKDSDIPEERLSKDTKVRIRVLKWKRKIIKKP